MHSCAELRSSIKRTTHTTLLAHLSLSQAWGVTEGGNGAISGTVSYFRWVPRLLAGGAREGSTAPHRTAPHSTSPALALALLPTCGAGSIGWLAPSAQWAS